MPNQQHLEMVWKYILKNIFCFVLSQWLCRLCQTCLLPTSTNEAYDTPYRLLMKTDLISSSTFLCFFRAVSMSWCSTSLLEKSLFIFCIPLLHVKFSTANDLPCLYRVTHVARYCIISYWHSVLYQL